MEEFKIIKEEMLFDENFDFYENLVEKIKWELLPNVWDYEYCLKDSIVECESPIEQLLALSFERINLSNTIMYNPFVDVLLIEKQAEIICDSKKYRADFLIHVKYKNQGIKLFVVECDGHEFHQKTKEQVRYDNERQRNLQKNGYEIIRFSGSEIWGGAYKCAIEVLNIILNNCKYIKDKGK